MCTHGWNVDESFEMEYEMKWNDKHTTIAYRERDMKQQMHLDERKINWNKDKWAKKAHAHRKQVYILCSFRVMIKMYV